MVQGQPAGRDSAGSIPPRHVDGDDRRPGLRLSRGGPRLQRPPLPRRRRGPRAGHLQSPHHAAADGVPRRPAAHHTARRSNVRGLRHAGGSRFHGGVVRRSHAQGGHHDLARGALSIQESGRLRPAGLVVQSRRGRAELRRLRRVCRARWGPRPFGRLLERGGVAHALDPARPHAHGRVLLRTARPARRSQAAGRSNHRLLAAEPRGRRRFSSGGGVARRTTTRRSSIRVFSPSTSSRGWPSSPRCCTKKASTC